MNLNAYTAAFKPNSNVIAVKSTEGFLGFYDLDSLTLIKKITVTRAGAQDEGFAFTPDGRYFCNIEKPDNSCQTQLSIYDAVSFERMNTLFTNEKKMVLDNLEFDKETGFTEKEFEWNPLNKLERIEPTSIKEIFDSVKG